MASIRYIHGIVVVNRPDLLERAVESVRPLWDDTFILDNSPDGFIGRSRTWPVPVIRPTVPLTCAQSMNCLLRIARERGADVFGYQHNDSEAYPASLEKYRSILLDRAGSDRRWATILTNYDVLSAYNVKAAEDIGEWDVHFPQPNYRIDVDWFHRARLKGYELVHTGLAVKHHGSATVKSSSFRGMITDITEPMNNEYYQRKWGGPPGQEAYAIPWNGVVAPD